MADQRPTEAQWKAIRELDKHLSVSAGAGAGKTWVLTERYTAMLAGRPLVLPPLELEAEEAQREAGAPARPHQIVAITFTKEAAGEMKSRIRERLSQWKSEASDDLKRQIGQLKEEVERASITTIHGYCSELLREYPVEAGIDPHFYVLEESEARFWLDESIREILDAGLSLQQAAEIRLVTEYGYEALVSHLARFYPSVREQTEDFAQMAEVTLANLLGMSARLGGEVERLERLLTNIGEIDLSSKDTSKGSAKKGVEIQQALPAILRTLQDWRANGWEYREEISHLFTQLTNGWGVLVKELKEDVNPMKELVNSMKGLLIPSGLLDAVRDVCHLLEQAHHLYSERKTTERALDFTDLQNLAVRLLQYPTVRQWQAERLRFLMVDEFQDTNPVQKQLLDALSLENDNLRLFVVGDAKQSIYRFRGADLEVFLQTQDQVRGSGGEHLSLSHNFRTQSPIIRFINRLFECLMPTIDNGPRYATQYEAMLATRDPEHPHPMVEILHLNPESDSATDRLREAQAIARRIQQMVGEEMLIPSKEGGLRPVEYRDITLLFSAMSNVSLYEHALQTAGIPYYIIGSRHFFRRQEVIDLAMLLQAIVEERDVLALIGALRSPLFGVSDEALYWLGQECFLAEDWRETAIWHKIAPDDQKKLLRATHFLSTWRREKAYKSAGDLLTTILEQTGYEQALLLTFGGTQKVGNVRKLLDSAYEQPAERAGVLSFLQYLNLMIEQGVNEEDAQVESDNSNVVKIMTVHKSKGLEFPIVILPDMARTFNTGSDGKFQYDPEYGLAVSFTEKEEWNEFGFGPAMKEQDKLKSKEEERRKLYVAMTRARDYLLLVGTREEPKKAVSLDSGNWFDWLVGVIADGTLSQMEGSIQAEWPEVKWTNGEGLLGEASEDKRVASAGKTTGAANRLDFSAIEEIAANVATQEDAQDKSEQLKEKFPLLGAISPSTTSATTNSKGILLSVSALLTYMTCPRQYFYRYEWKLPERTRERRVEHAQLDLFGGNEPDEDQQLLPLEREDKEPGHDATERGTLIHRVLEWVEDPSQADDLIRRALAERRIVGVEADKWYPILAKDLQTYVASPLFQEVQAALEKRSEMMFRLSFGVHDVTGILDKVIRKKDGRAVVIDYKTNRITSRDLKRTTQHYTPQLQLYTLVVQRLLGWDVERSVLYFTALDQEADVPTTDTDLRGRESIIQAALDHIAATQDDIEAYPVAEDDHPCRTCGYLLLCKGKSSMIN